MKIIAWYLPQFHTIPENDAWWGEGFTEWTNVKAAKSYHSGQIQPRVPLNDNYYNLLDDEVKRWQVNLAKEYGVYGFAMYHYWFDGKLLLEKPVEQYLANKALDLPFCICWANEHWTNRWIASKESILIEQHYGDEAQWKDHFEYLLPFLRDERYIRVDGKPLVIIYRPELIDRLNDMMDLWQALARGNGLPGLSLAYQGEKWDLSAGIKKDDSRFDLNIEFQPSKVFNAYRHGRHRLLSGIQSILPKRLENSKLVYKLKEAFVRNDESGTAFDFDELWKTVLNTAPVDGKSVPGAFVGWDNSPRKKEQGIFIRNVTPQKFEKYLAAQIRRTRNVYHKDMLFLYAWNEWAEGGYLEPDRQYGYGFLEAIRGALKETGEWPVR